MLLPKHTRIIIINKPVNARLGIPGMMNLLFSNSLGVIGILKMMISACQSAYYFYVSSSICGRVKRKSSERFSTRKKSHVKNPHMAF